MKKTIQFLCVLTVAILATGCVKMEMSMDIKADKSMNLSITEAINDAIIEQSEEEVFSQEDLDKAEKSGFKVKEYSEDGMSGYTFTKSIANIDDVSKESNVVGDLGIVSSKDGSKYLFSVEKGFFKNTYKAKLISSDADSTTKQIDEAESKEETMEEDTTDLEESDNLTIDENITNDTTDQSLTDEANEPATTENTTTDNQVTTENEINMEGNDNLNNLLGSGLASSMSMNFKVNLPQPALSNNATKVENDGKTLTWNLLKFEEDNMSFEFELYNMNNIYIAAGIGVLLLLVIIILIIRSISKKHKKANLTDTGNNNGIPEMPTTPEAGPANFVDIENQTTTLPNQPTTTENVSSIETQTSPLDNVPDSASTVSGPTLQPQEPVQETPTAMPSSDVPNSPVAPVSEVVPAVPEPSVTPMETPVNPIPQSSVTPQPGIPTEQSQATPNNNVVSPVDSFNQLPTDDTNKQ